MYESDQRTKVALFRYGVIAPLVCRRLSSEEWRATRQQVLTQLYEYPMGKRAPVPERTLRHWLKRYKKHGFRGLFDEFRSDRGKCKAMSEELLEQSVLLRKEEPRRSVHTIVELLKQSVPAEQLPNERTLARHLKKHRATAPFLKKGAGTYQRWEQQYANTLWHGDTSHGIWLRDPENPGKAKKTKFIVFVDDATRICTHGEFYFDEQLPKLVDCFGKALLKRGRPQRMLFDNAFIYHSTTMSVMSAELGIEISFCRPRAPQGKGKVERFIRTVQESFMLEASKAAVETLAELNALFQGWVARYHQRVHSELDGLTPEERWQKDVNLISIVTPQEIQRALMLRSRRMVNLNTATVSVDGREYQASADLAGQEVEVRWSNERLDQVELWMLGEFIETAPLFEAKPYVDPSRRRPEADQAVGPVLESAKEFARDLLNAAPEPAALFEKTNECLACAEFARLFASILERALEQQELELLAKFFKNHAPLRKQQVRESLLRAVSVKGSELHLRYYLEQLEQSLRRR